MSSCKGIKIMVVSIFYMCGEEDEKPIIQHTPRGWKRKACQTSMDQVLVRCEAPIQWKVPIRGGG